MANDNMVVVAAVARKGGCGKSTLVKALASAALGAGKSVLLIDTDPQGDLGGWFERATEQGMVPAGASFARARDTEELDARINEAYDGDATDFIFIDTAGTAGAWADQIAMLADYLITPVLATSSDLVVGTQTAQWFQRLQERASRPEDLPPHRVVLTRFPSKATKLEVALAKRAHGLFPVINTIVQDRAAYKEMDERGFLGEIAQSYQSQPSPLERNRARHFQEALVEAMGVLNNIMER
ncbi:ParA family protein [Rubellimicrobium aerolatum]|uniref:ParA family protein n=1 Tax=Rubellimicrobium aerolatum TaxID=490979 RepID=A0ABW0SDX6_9RHOB|nr:ParA family protein [Rubellimicrobium aerolatum]MBP1806996.1 chromosome partitioning protein [Rubellimicrobium aerolatum]